MDPDADLSPRGVSQIIASLLVELDLDDVTIVANDTGGAITQILVTEQPDRIGRLVLTPCDAFENFLPPLFRPLQWLAHIPGAIWLNMQIVRIKPLRRLPIIYGRIAKHTPPQSLLTRWLAPGTASRGVRRDIAKLLKSIDKKDTLAAAERLPEFTRPALHRLAAGGADLPHRTRASTRCSCCPTRGWSRSTTAGPSRRWTTRPPSRPRSRISFSRTRRAVRERRRPPGWSLRRRGRDASPAARTGGAR